MRTKLPDDPMQERERVDGGRRTLFALAAASPLLLLGLVSRPARAQTAACFDLAKLPMSQRSIRTSLGFQMKAADPAKACSTCNFYKPGTGNCGTCEIFNNGPTAAGSTCMSWAKKG